MFWGCTNLKNVTILGNADAKEYPNILKDCHPIYFHFSTSITGLEFTPANNAYGLVSKANGFCPGDEEYTFQQGVTEFDVDVLQDCSSIKVINIPNSVHKVCQYAFSGCTSIETITLPTSVNEIGDGLFKDCSKVHTINITGPITEIGKFNFENCPALKTLIVPNTLTKCISTVAESVEVIMMNFNDKCLNSEITVKIPSIVTKIGEKAFRRCKKMEALYMGKRVRSIERLAFNEVWELRHLYYPENPVLEYIGDEAFSNMTEMYEISMPKSLVSIGKHIFIGSIQLITIYVYDNFDLEKYEADLKYGTIAHIEVLPLNTTKEPTLEPIVPTISGADTKYHLSTGAIIGLSIGGVASVTIFVVVVVVISRRKNDGDVKLVTVPLISNEAKMNK